MLATAAWTLGWLLDRLFWPGVLPGGWAALACVTGSLVIAGVWFAATRDPAQAGAAALDEAAGLRERISTSLHVQTRTGDPFASAVVADAERIVTGLTARQFVPIRWSRSLTYGVGAIAVALLSLLLPELDLLGRNEAQASERDRLAGLEAARGAVARPISIMRQIAERHPDIDTDKVRNDLNGLLDQKRRADPEVLRRETVKKLDRLQDSLKNKANADRFKALSETKKRLKQLGRPKDPKSELGMLLGALAAGNFQQAQQAVKKLQERLAKRVREGSLDAETAEKMRKQLNEVAKKLQQAAQDKQSTRELKNAGLSEAEAKRVLEALSKKDPKQLERLAKELAERLKGQGISKEQIKKMLEKMQQRQQASKQCKKMGDKMAGAAKQMGQGDMQAAQSELAEAGEMLSEMEQLDQAFNELDSQIGQLDDLRDDLNDQDAKGKPKCKQCKGTGFRADGAACPWCNGSGL